jgi:methyltransferase (TIGR00027 family)
MHSRQPSQTMVRTAMRRAAHQLLDRPRIFEDPVAVGIVPEASKDAILEATEDHFAPLPVLLRSLFAFRSRFTEDRLAEAVGRGAHQYAIIGAGLDTFPWRQPSFAERLKIFYVDHPVTLARSTVCFRERGLTIPSNLQFVAANLEERDLPERLRAHGFENDIATFCSALGVVQYISRGALDGLLGFAASLPARSEIVLSFVPPEDDLQSEDRVASIHSFALTEAMGEPWITRLAANEIFGDLTRLGFGEIFHLTPKRAQERYFADRNDGLRAPHFEQLIAALV